MKHEWVDLNELFPLSYETKIKIKKMETYALLLYCMTLVTDLSSYLTVFSWLKP